MNKQKQKPLNRWQKGARLLLLCSLLLLFSIMCTKAIIALTGYNMYSQYEVPTTHSQQPAKSELTSIQKIQQFDNISFLPANFTIDNLTELFTDFIWDIDGDSGHIDLVGFIYQFIPGLGSSGSTFIQPLFYLSVFGGFIILAKYIQKRRSY